MISVTSKSDQLYQTIRKDMMQNHGTEKGKALSKHFKSNPMDSPVARLTKWVRDYEVGIHSFFVTVNFVAWMVILFGAFTGRLVWAFENSEVNLAVVSEIIMESELVICNDNVCRYFDKPDKILSHSQSFPDGPIIIFPEGIGTEEELIAAKTHVREYWQFYLSNK